MKRWMSLILAAAMVLSLWGCAGEQEPTAPPEEETTQETTLPVQTEPTETEPSATETAATEATILVPELPMPEIQGPEIPEGVLPILIGDSGKGKRNIYFTGWDIASGTLTPAEYWYQVKYRDFDDARTAYWNGGYDVQIHGEVLDTAQGISVSSSKSYYGLDSTLMGFQTRKGSNGPEGYCYITSDETWGFTLPAVNEELMAFADKPNDSCEIKRVSVDGEYGVVVYTEYFSSAGEGVGLQLICCKWKLDDPEQAQWTAFNADGGDSGYVMVNPSSVAYAGDKLYVAGYQVVHVFDLATGEQRRLDETNIFALIWDEEKGAHPTDYGVNNTLTIEAVWNDIVIINFDQQENGVTVDYYLAVRDEQLLGVMTRNLHDDVLRFYNGQMEFLGYSEQFSSQGIGGGMIMFAANR